MDTNLSDLMTNGYMIYPSNGAFVVRKMAVPGNERVIDGVEAPSYELAVQRAVELHSEPVMHVWLATARYNRGLGVEYKNLPEVVATSQEEAMESAIEMANICLGKKCCVSEVRVRLKRD